MRDIDDSVVVTAVADAFDDKARDVDQRARLRTPKPRPILDAYHAWLVVQRQKATDGSPPPDNNHIENRIQPIALGRSNWSLAGVVNVRRRHEPHPVGETERALV